MENVTKLQLATSSPVVLLRLRLRFGVPRHIQWGQTFRVAVDLVDEMAQPSTVSVAVCVALEIDATSSSGDVVPPPLQTRTTLSEPGHWRVDCVVGQSPTPSETVLPMTLRLRLACTPPTTPLRVQTPTLTALQRFCTGSQWVSLSAHDHDGLALVLPVLSDEIIVGGPQPFSPSRPTSARCLREFALPAPHGVVYIEEDYGHAMGSHIWDASIWLSLAIVESAAVVVDSEPPAWTVVELGAGCGLVACVVARLHTSSRVVATERCDALPLLRANVTRNGVDTRVASQELLWGTPENPVTGAIPVHPDMVLAADVLYHWSAHEPLLKTLGSLCHGSPAARVLVAHKRRSVAAAQRLDVLVETGGGDACCGTDCAFVTQWHVERIARLGHDVELLQLSRRT